MNGALEEALRGKRLLYLDTALFIYFVESNPRYTPAVRALFERITRGDAQGVTSYLTLLEVLIHPLRLGRRDLAEQYRRILTRAAGLSLAGLDERTVIESAALRARGGLRIPDAVHLATAHEVGADAFVTNDRRLRALGDVQVLILEELL